MSHYTLRGFPSIAAQFVVSAVNGYFHSIACAAHAKGVDDSLQVMCESQDMLINLANLPVICVFSYQCS